MTRTQTLRSIEILLDMADRLKNAYLWTPPSSAAGRRDYEKKHTIAPITWEEGGRNYSAELVVNCSCSHIYVTKNYYRDGEKVNVKAIKNSYKRMVAENG